MLPVAMFPYIVILPLWLLVAVAYPIFQSFHALQEKSSERKTWLFYWVCFVLCALFAGYVEWLIQIPFYLVSFYVDIYYEMQLGAIVYMVFPTTMGIKTLQDHVEKDGQKVWALGLQKSQGVALFLREKLIKTD